MAIDIGRIAYQAYADNFQRKQEQHSPHHEQWEDCDDPQHCWCNQYSIPRKWEDLGKQEQDAWRHSACAVLSHVERERNQADAEDEEEMKAWDGTIEDAWGDE